MNPRRLIWLLMPLGIFSGVLLGLYLAWGPLVGVPVAHSPAQLHSAEKEQYIRLIASAYAVEQDIRLARKRLESLDAGNYALWVSDLAEQDAVAGEEASAGRLARLAVALAVSDPRIIALAATATPSPTPEPVQEEGTLEWAVVDHNLLTCEQFDEGTDPMLIVRAIDGDGAPVEGVILEMARPDGSREPLHTDENGEAMMPFNGVWTLNLADGSDLTVSDEELVADCTEADPDDLHATRITFQLRAAP